MAAKADQRPASTDLEGLAYSLPSVETVRRIDWQVWKDSSGLSNKKPGPSGKEETGRAIKSAEISQQQLDTLMLKLSWHDHRHSLQHSPFAERERFIAGNDEMIERSHIDQRKSSLQRICYASDRLSMVPGIRTGGCGR